MYRLGKYVYNKRQYGYVMVNPPLCNILEENYRLLGVSNTAGSMLLSGKHALIQHHAGNRLSIIHREKTSLPFVLKSPFHWVEVLGSTKHRPPTSPFRPTPSKPPPFQPNNDAFFRSTSSAVFNSRSRNRRKYAIAKQVALSAFTGNDSGRANASISGPLACFSRNLRLFFSGLQC